MSKLSFEALQQRAASTNQDELLTSVSGGTFGDCHPDPTPPADVDPSDGVFEIIWNNWNIIFN
ncbi:hypothetical protein ULMA_15910 [Patiriisocius marinus]|uniref:Uncharacterized protein n=1 Tax=Patiriisocius marinus TaxID=1397112 RepID=A0A5J4J0Z9_9FLAO|nr:hypothetical protein [Patiriisocius marinus]GER59483.1 hypothetical protein ULMA_15910 [Patiriisocius marinus]